MLTQYLSDTRLILNDATAQFYSDTELTRYINRARSYVATLGECVRDSGTISVPSAVSVLVFLSVSPTNINSASKLINLRSLYLAGGAPIELRTYEWWVAYVQSITIGATQRIAAISRQGAVGAAAGTINIKNGSSVALPYTVSVDGIWLPIPLVDDTTQEDIPQLWTEAICYYTAYLAFLRAQRQTDAEDMLQQFHQKMDWARVAVTSSQLPSTTNTLGGPGTHEAGNYTSSGFSQQRGG